MNQNNTVMTWDKLLTMDCYNSTNVDDHSCLNVESDCRNVFQKCIDKITFSNPFRRLSRKTQVHPLNENDHIHSRLIHSLETSCVGRTLGQYIGDFLEKNAELPEGFTVEHIGQIVQAACLAHDIGNPPFGHSGEEAIKSWARDNRDTKLQHIPHKNDFMLFDGNAMAFRILVSTGYDGGEKGMTPPYSVLGALLKYPKLSKFAGNKEKFSCLGSEEQALEKVAETLGLLGSSGNYVRHPLAFLTEAADDLCYRVLDLEDATELNILNSSYMLRNFKDVLKFGDAKVKKLRTECVRERNSKIRSKIMDEAVYGIIDTFKENYEKIMLGQLDKSLMEVSNNKVIKVLMEVYKKASKNIFYSRRKVELEIGAQQSISTLLNTYAKASNDFCDDNDNDHKKKIESLLGKNRCAQITSNGTECFYNTLIMILDYITGMTDQYATEQCRCFLGLGKN